MGAEEVARDIGGCWVDGVGFRVGKDDEGLNVSLR